MNKKLIILGNGFSIDFISHIKEEFQEDKKIQSINLSNLFCNGDKVSCPWDNSEKGFLSFEHTPNLWTLGVRPDISNEKANTIILDIVTSTNAFLRYKDENRENAKLNVIDDRKIYLRAYCELKEYIKSLMLYYDSLITNTKIKTFISKKKLWGWKSIFEDINKPDIKTYIITYNYDLWLERILNIMNIDYDLLHDTGKNIQVLKPHGSIDFINKGESSKFYKIIPDLNDSTTLDTIQIKKEPEKRSIIIPPAGASQSAGIWAEEIRSKSFAYSKTIRKEDQIIICGISYWNVDRYEIDKLLCSVDSDCQISFINPYPPSEFNATLMSIFNRYKVFKSSDSYKNI